jgi:uncharacterized protein (DUF2141 family)
MNTRNPIAALLLLTAALPATAADVDIVITEITEPTGTIYWSLFDSAESFDNGGAPVIAARSRVHGDSLHVTLRDLPSGRYALRLFHDSNGNGELDRNLLGIPQEGYGFSNDAGARGPATFDDAAVTVDDDTALTVRVR